MCQGTIRLGFWWNKCPVLAIDTEERASRYIRLYLQQAPSLRQGLFMDTVAIAAESDMDIPDPFEECIGKPTALGLGAAAFQTVELRCLIDAFVYPRPIKCQDHRVASIRKVHYEILTRVAELAHVCFADVSVLRVRCTGC
jgi:hypothetical protein